MITPRRPARISEYALACLEALRKNNLGRCISLGGAFGLAHYIEYRTTHDVDAWWTKTADAEARRQLVEAVEDALKTFGQVRTRTWGDVVSIELVKDSRTVFSFQIARRSVELHEPILGVWLGEVSVDSFDDLVASKMTALIERGAPRDFRDIYMICKAGYGDIARCWALWVQRQEAMDEDADRRRAALAIQTHLGRIEQARPLDKITDEAERMEARQLRVWFLEEFIRGFSD